MRTAESFLNEHSYKRFHPEINFENLELIINEARIEAIKECAENANVQGYLVDGSTHYRVNKKSILSLIEQVK